MGSLQLGAVGLSRHLLYPRSTKRHPHQPREAPAQPHRLIRWLFHRLPKKHQVLYPPRPDTHGLSRNASPGSNPSSEKEGGREKGSAANVQYLRTYVPYSREYVHRKAEGRTSNADARQHPDRTREKKEAEKRKTRETRGVGGERDRLDTARVRHWDIYQSLRGLVRRRSRRGREEQNEETSR